MFSAKDLRRLILPLVVEQLLLVTVGMADTVMVSSVGQEAVSSISLVDAINLLLINVFSALGTGGAIVTAQYLGRNDEENASAAAKQLVYVVAAGSSLVAVVCLLFNGGILRLLFGAVEPAVMEGAQTYFYITALSYPFIGVYNAGAAVFRAMGNSRVSMACSFLMNLINIGGNAILIYGVGIGVAGAAIPTLLSRAAAAVVIIHLLCKGGGRVQVRELWKPEYHPAMVRGILRVGVPNGLENGMFQIGKVLVQGLVASLGTAAIAANAMANNVSTFPHISGSAVGLALVTVVGPCVGAGEYQQARKYIIRLTGLVYLSMGLLEVCRPAGGNHPDGGGADPGLCHLRHYLLARRLCHPQRPAGRRGRPVHHAHLHPLHVDLPHRVQLPPLPPVRHGGHGGLAGHVYRLDFPRRRLCVAVPQRALEKPPGGLIPLPPVLRRGFPA